MNCSMDRELGIQMGTRTGALNDLLERGRLVWRLVNDARVPRWIKLGIPLVVAIYFISPIDLIPDFIPVVGQLDDIGVILLGMSLIIRFSPAFVVNEHKRALGYEVDVPGSAGSSGAGASAGASGQPTRRVSSDAIDGEYEVVRPDQK